MTDPIYIDTGRSVSGWSFWGPLFACDQLWFIKNIAPPPPNPGMLEARTQGSMGHILLGHHYARLGAAQPGGFVFEGQTHTDPEDFLDPVEAVRRWAREADRRGEDASPFIANTIELYRQYRIREPYFPDRVVGVEQLARLTLGTNKDGEFGLWVDENLDEPTLLDCPALFEAHPAAPLLKHGEPIHVTKRLDLIAESGQNGKIYIDDHKVTGGSVSKSVVDKYAMDGQFSVNDWVGRQTWGEQYGGVRLNLVQRRDPWQVRKQVVPAAPRRNKLFPRHLYYKAHHLAEMLAGTVSGDLGQDDWQMTQTDLLCYHRFGRCDGFDICRFG